MKVFISWSGERSRAVAEAFRDWLPQVIQAVEPWVSVADIEKGSRWGVDVPRHLEECQVGLICLTPENLSAPWILFEAGALAKTLDKTFVCPYLLDLQFADIRDPLAQFQATRAEKEDTRKLLHTINRAVSGVANEQALSEMRLNTAFEKWWPDLERTPQCIPPAPTVAPPKRSDRELLEEVLQLVRGLMRSLLGSEQASLFEESRPLIDLERALRQSLAAVGKITQQSREAGRRAPSGPGGRARDDQN
jgi:hypothetical protein